MLIGAYLIEAPFYSYILDWLLVIARLYSLNRNIKI